MTDLRIEHLRGGLLESVHRVSLAVVDSAGRRVARAGDAELVTFMRSAAKPFQAVPLVLDGAVDRFTIGSEELALACASHNSEAVQVAKVAALLARVGCREDDLVCGPHRPLWRDFAVLDGAAPETAPPSPLASNCSGKHTGMLALARHHGWPTAGYHRSGHAVQQRVKREVARFTGMREDAIGEGVDGCGVVSFAVPLARMAQACARLATDGDDATRAVVRAMTAHPELVAGQGRLCTALMRAYSGALLVKVGAEGVYVAALPERGLGLALKVEDGDGRAAMVALVAALEQLGLEPSPVACLPAFAELAIHNTRGEPVGAVRAAGTIAWE